jgi:cob(I)alamin adenosyltransferase
VLDEINLALPCQLLEVKDALKFQDRISKRTDVVLTGRYAPKELVNRAEFVNEVKDISLGKR